MYNTLLNSLKRTIHLYCFWRSKTKNYFAHFHTPFTVSSILMTAFTDFIKSLGWQREMWNIRFIQFECRYPKKKRWSRPNVPEAGRVHGILSLYSRLVSFSKVLRLGTITLYADIFPISVTSQAKWRHSLKFF